jgi:hypothetical protein
MDVREPAVSVCIIEHPALNVPVGTLTSGVYAKKR